MMDVLHYDGYCRQNANMAESEMKIGKFYRKSTTFTAPKKKKKKRSSCLGRAFAPHSSQRLKIANLIFFSGEVLLEVLKLYLLRPKVNYVYFYIQPITNKLFITLVWQILCVCFDLC